MAQRPLLLSVTFQRPTVTIKNTEPPPTRTSPGEIKRRAVSWTLRKKLAQKRSRAGRWCWARERQSWTSFASVVPQGSCATLRHRPCDSAPHNS